MHYWPRLWVFYIYATHFKQLCLQISSFYLVWLDVTLFIWSDSGFLYIIPGVFYADFAFSEPCHLNLQCNIICHILKNFPYRWVIFILDFSSRYIIILRIMNLHCQKNFQRILSVYIIIDTFAKNIWILITLLSTSGCYGSEGILHIALWRISVHWATMTTVIPHLPKCDKILVQFVIMCVNLFVGNQGEYSLEDNGCNDKRYGLLYRGHQFVRYPKSSFFRCLT